MIPSLSSPTSEPGWFPPVASSNAAEVDSLFMFIFWLSLFFFVLIIGLTTVFVIKYRRRPGSVALPSPSHSNKLEFFWSAVPTLLIMVIFAMGTTAYLRLMEPPAGQQLTEIQVTARKWSWRFEHPEGKSSGDLHVVLDDSVVLVMNSPDVLHSLYVPAFRVKQDIVPGRYAKLWFKAIQAGSFPIYCAEYCGTNHSQMLSQVVVHKDRADYDKWANSKVDESMPLPELGKLVYETRGCKACHTIDGKKSVGPTLKGMWGKEEALTGGGTAIVDENYIRESIVDPKAKVVSGYAPAMPATPLEEREYLGIIAYIKSLKD